MRKTFFYVALMAVIMAAVGLLGQPLYAQSGQSTDAKKIAQYRSWTAYRFDNGAEKICYITAKPTASLPQGAVRGDIFFSISHRPKEQVRNEVGVRIGYPFSETSRPYAMIGDKRFQFFTGASLENGVKEWAWVSNLQQHAEMILAMKRGAKLTFRGTSARGTLTTDTYSLLGFTKAIQSIDAACP